MARLGRPPVDDDLVGAGRRPSLDEAVGVERGVGDPGAGHPGRAVAADGLPVGALDLGVAVDVGHGVGHAVDGRHPGHDGGVDRPPLGDGGPGVAVGLELVGAADDDVGAAVGRGEEVGEVGPERVGEGQRPGQEGDAEEDGQHGAGQAPLPRRQAAEGDAEHVSLPGP